MMYLDAFWRERARSRDWEYIHAPTLKRALGASLVTHWSSHLFYSSYKRKALTESKPPDPNTHKKKGTSSVC